MSEYLTTKELAALLRIKERKVYDLAASGQVPCTKTTGKLLFPRAQIETWLQSATGGGLGPARQTAPKAARASVFLGSHDPLLEWALRESRCRIATDFDASIDGLQRFAKGEGIATGLHLFDPLTETWNVAAVAGSCRECPAVLITWCHRSRGLILAPGREKDVATIADLKGLTVAMRQPEAGAQVLLESELAKHRLRLADLNCEEVCRSETDAALAVSEGRADATFGLEASAAQYRLPFIPVAYEVFALLVDRKAYFDEPFQTLITFARSPAFRKRAKEIAGYDVRPLGRVIWNA
jgi:excisionase family DNA binding protein